ncbi:MAG: C10 family peptidase [Bacteroidetes bacterium]|nr:C10 family peptidase [Bacteroidota bacterium]
MKRVLFFTAAIFLLINSALFAKLVEVKDARLAGKNFYYERLTSNLRQPVLLNDLKIIDEYTEREGAIPVYYIFNFTETGYIIISADDACYPVLGYSFESAFSPENIPSNLEYWLSNYKYEINSVRSGNLKPDAAISYAWKQLSSSEPKMADNTTSPTDVAPMITSLWNQDFPYNALCPKDPAIIGSYSGRVPVGCVATAMSQIMHYWRYPFMGYGSHCIFPQQPAYGQQCADFGTTTYDWNGMPNQTYLESNALAVLAYQCSVAVDMQYDPNGSGSNLQKAAAAMRTYFKYASGTQFQSRNSNYSTWVNTLKSDVDAGQPVEYSGDDNSTGHAFVLDGYQQVGTDYMFHFNWGWGGSANGYFYINNLNPNGSNFNSHQGAVVGIKPDPTAYPGSYLCSGAQTITTNFGAIEDGSGPVAYYPGSAACSWLIAPDDSIKNITLNFVRFSTASNDFVKVYDGENANAPLLGSYSGALTSMPSVTSTGSKMFIAFNASGITTGAGWLANFTTATNPFCGSSTTLTESFGTISDGSGIFDYRNLSNCKWKIMPPGVSKLVLTVNNFNTEPNVDKVMVFDIGANALLGTWSGAYTTMPAPITSTTGAVMVMWVSNNSVRGSGWEISYSPVVGSIERYAFEDLQIYPNPANEIINLSFTVAQPQKIEIKLISITGETLYTDNLIWSNGDFKTAINISTFSKGIYLLRMKSDLGIVVKKIAIQ